MRKPQILRKELRMYKKLFIAIVAVVLSTHLIGCTSDEAKDPAAEASGSGVGEELAAENAEMKEEGAAEPAKDGEVKEAAKSDELDKVDELDEKAKPAAGETAKADKATGGDELSLDEGDASFPNDIAKTEGGTPPPANPPPTDSTPVFTEGATPVAEGAQPTTGDSPTPPIDSASSAPVVDRAEVPKVYAPVVKIKDAPFQQGGVLLNRVYLGRPGDTYASVSTKIYGNKSKSKELRKWNPQNSASLKTGNKVYYNSAKDPADSSRMMTYYEEAGIPPVVYTTQAAGESIRTLSKQWLGSGDSWREVWATNPQVESKGTLPAGTELRYWPKDVAAGAPVVQQASNPVLPTPPPTQAEPAPVEPLPTQAINTPPPPHATGTPDQHSIPPVAAQTNPTVPPPMNNTPPPIEKSPSDSPAPAAVRKREKQEASADAGDAETMKLMAFGGGLIVAAIALVAIVRRRKRLDLSQTQV